MTDAASIVAAAEALASQPSFTSTVRCERPTVLNQPCKLFRMAVSGREWPSCPTHATAEEYAEFNAAAAEIRRARRRLTREADRLILEHHQTVPVECWSWPVTNEHRQRAAEAQACEDPAQARRLALELLYDWQQGRCAVCVGRARVLDHCHETGLVRGRLCRSCNLSEGGVFIPGGQFERYRGRNPASILGLAIRYYSPFTGWAEPERTPAQ